RSCARPCSPPGAGHRGFAGWGIGGRRGRDDLRTRTRLDASAGRRIHRQPVSEYRQTYSTTVAAPVTECFAVLTAFEDYPRWSSPITSCRVLERGPDGLPKRVEFALDMTVKTIRYVLDYTFDPPRGATWKLVEGDVKDVEGPYRF